MRRESYQIRLNNAWKPPLRRSRSFKVTDFGTNQKLTYDLLLLINSNLPQYLLSCTVSKLWSNFRWREGSASL